MIKNNILLVIICCICLSACGGKRTTKPAPAPVPPPSASKPVPTSPPASTPTQPNSNKPMTDADDAPGGYYLDDGPGDNPPQSIDNIPNAVPKKEALLERANRPYKALGETYKPMTQYEQYKVTGVASWYGKRYHGKKTSSGEVYDMYGMSAAHPTLPLPSYAKVTNPANGRYVVVRVNDRGPFKHDRIIDLSYAAAYKLRYSAQGSAPVIVEAIDASNTSAAYIASYTAPSAAAAKATNTPIANPVEAKKVTPVANTTAANSTAINEYFVQAGAFKNEAYADNLLRKIESLEISENAGINKVYNSGLHRLKIGPFDNKLQADSVAADIRKRLNVPAIIVNQ